jgi:hypothetical protein
MREYHYSRFGFLDDKEDATDLYIASFMMLSFSSSGNEAH